MLQISTAHMTQAKPGEGQFDAVFHFLNAVEAIVEDGILLEENDNETQLELDDSEDRLKAFAFIEAEYAKVSHCWRRVLFAGQVAIDNACDPNNSTLSFKPEIAAAIDQHDRLTKALHAHRCHPEFSYVIVPSYGTKIDLSIGGFERNLESEVAGDPDQCWRRRIPVEDVPP